jgi:hypothetical protein
MFFVELAQLYIELVEESPREVFERMERRLAERGDDYKAKTLEDFIKHTRPPTKSQPDNLGILTKAPSGRAGGTLTPEAHAIVARTRADERDNADYVHRHTTWVTLRHPETGGEFRTTLAAADHSTSTERARERKREAKKKGEPTKGLAAWKVVPGTEGPRELEGSK